MSIINKGATLNPFTDLIANVTEYVPRATTSTFGVVAIGSGINVDSLGRIYLDTQEYSDRLAAIEAEAATTLATQKTEVAAAIAQVNLAQSQTITALTLEVSNLKTNLTASISATKTDLINRADQLAQNVANITQQLTQDKATFTQEIQDALDYLKDEASVASALRTPRKIQGVDFDGTQDINLPVFTTQTDGLVPKRVGATSTKYLREDGTWVVPTNTTYALLTKAIAEAGTATTANTISAQVLKDAIKFHTPTVTDITGNASTASKLATTRTINGVSFDGTANIEIPNETPTATETVGGKAKIATTAIAQAGTNDTDIITAKKLRDALNARGNAPISACRAWVVFTCVSNVVTILNSMNILSVTRLDVSNFKITYATPMPTANNVPLVSGQTTLDNSGQFAITPAIRNILAESCEVYHDAPYADFPLVTLGVFC